jgi:small ligand-binding sensory domain FIST
MAINRKDYPTQHTVITPSNVNNLDVPMLIYCNASGTIAVVDISGESVTYTLTAGQMVPVLAIKVLATGTNSASIIGLK